MDEERNGHIARVQVIIGCLAPSFIVEVFIPEGRDEEEYVDEFLDTILQDNFRYNCEWDFV